MSKTKFTITALVLTTLLSQSAVYAESYEGFLERDAARRQTVAVYSAPTNLQEEDNKAVTQTVAPAQEDASQASSSSKLVSGFGGLVAQWAFTDTFTRLGSKAVNAAATAVTGSSYAAKAIEIAAFDTVYNVARNAAFVVGVDTPDLLAKAYKAATSFSSNPNAFYDLGTEVFKTGARVVSTQVAGYLGTEPVTNLASGAVSFGITALTGSYWLGQAAGGATKAAIHYTGAGNLVSKAIGYSVPDVASSVYGYLTGK